MEKIEKRKENRDWTGNASVRNCNSRSANAEKNDYYATEPKAVELWNTRTPKERGEEK